MTVFYFCHTDMHLTDKSGLHPLQAILDGHPEPRGARHVQALPHGAA